MTSRTRSPSIIAHRGASHEAPENTLAAFNLAWQEGADGIEADFRRTKDGRIVCIHDETTRRTTGGDLSVAESTLDELRQLDAGSWKGPRWAGERIPTIEEVLAAMPEGKRLFLELKSGADLLEPLQEILDKAPLAPAQIVLIGFDPHVMALARRRFRSFKLNFLVEQKRDETTGRVTPSWDQAATQLLEIEPDGLGVNAETELVDSAFVRQLRGMGLSFHVWTVNDLAIAQYFTALGVDSITTDRPGYLKENLPFGGN